MANYPETVRELYPADTRWGNGYVKPPLWGKVTAAFEAELDQQRAGIRETIAFFEDKYPAFHWWETNFVEIKPASSLLMQSVNPRLAFQCMADLTHLTGVVEKIAGFDTHAEYVDAYAARLALNGLAVTPDGQQQLDEAQSHMTPEDIEMLWQLTYGIGRQALGNVE